MTIGRLAGKVAIITGAASGMGLAHVRRFLEEGAQVVATDVDASGLSKLGASSPEALHTIRHDVASADDWSRVVEATLTRFGRLDVLVNNAGVFVRATLEETQEDDFRRLFEINQLGVFLGMKAVASAMRSAGGGSIVNISSTSGLVGRPATLAYTATKYAVRGMTKAAAADLGFDGVRVNSIHPGTVRTPMYDATTEAWKAKQLGELALARVAEPHEVSNLAIFLASDDASYCTGAEFVIDGGLTSR